MAQEIERKFLVQENALPDLSTCHKRRIEQAYLSARPTVRVRRDNEAFYLTYKGEGLLIREEHNLALTAEAYTHLAAKADGRRIEKDRFELPLDNGLTAEIDKFRGALSGLCLVEVEFSSTEAAAAFVPPSWFGTEVTQDPHYTNANRALALELPNSQPPK